MLDNIASKYNNTIHRTIKLKPIDVTSDTYTEDNEDSNVTKRKSKIGDHVKISKYKKQNKKTKNTKGYAENW